MSCEQNRVLEGFDPNDIALHNGTIYGLPFTAEDAKVILIPVPWEVTVSSGAGTAQGPVKILEASTQVDLYGVDTGEAWRAGIHMLHLSEAVSAESKRLRAKAIAIIDALAQGGNRDSFSADYAEIEKGCEELFAWIRSIALPLLQQEKIVGVVGGDHSVSLGLLQAYATVYQTFGVLHVDAHADLRQQYEGFTYSHASIMHHALALQQVSSIVQVGIRDFCSAEAELLHNNNRLTAFPWQSIAEARFQGVSWDALCGDIVQKLPEQVYISFDVDGLDPSLCPLTGTPVPGGLAYAEAVYLLKKICLSGKKIIGFDLVETGDGLWDGSVGARLLYELCCRAILSMK